MTSSLFDYKLIKTKNKRDWVFYIQVERYQFVHAYWWISQNFGIIKFAYHNVNTMKENVDDLKEGFEGARSHADAVMEDNDKLRHQNQVLT